MRGPAAALAALALVLPGALSAQAPQATGYPLRLYFSELEGNDSVYAAPAGGALNLTVAAYDNASRGLTAFTIRIWYNPSLVSFVSARSSCQDSVASPLGTPVQGSNYVELSASGCRTSNAYQHNVATVRLQLAGGATSGTGLYLEPRSLTDRTAVNRSVDGTGDFDEVCVAVGTWGDVDDDGQINSRDALIALSSAVGLPTTGFFVSRGDVDGDGFVGSRDALGMLSVSIGYPAAPGFHTGRAIPTACARQPVFSRALYFIRQGNTPGIAGASGLVVRAAGDSSQTIVGDSADGYPYYYGSAPRVSPDGSKVAFACYWYTPGYGQYLNICRANADGSALVNLTGGGYNTDEAPYWSPAGDSIAFVRNNQVWVMAADGSNQHIIPSSPSVYAVAWAPTSLSRRIAYASTSGQIRTRQLDLPANDTVVFSPTSYAGSPRSVDWSPGGDSLVFSLVVNGYSEGVFVADSLGLGASRVARLPGAYASDTKPTWTDQGIFFDVYQYYPAPDRHRLFLLRSDGSMVRIGRDRRSNFSAGMDKQ